MMRVFAALKPGITVSQARADLNGVASNLQKAYPNVYLPTLDYSIRTSALEEELTQRAPDDAGAARPRRDSCC